MLAITVALVALLTPFVTPWGPLNASTSPNDYSVDLGYQLNLGQAVEVRSVGCEPHSISHVYYSDAADPRLTRNSTYYF